MIKTANFCDICKNHVPDDKNGHIFFYNGYETIQRTFDKSVQNDVCLCISCIHSLKRLESFINVK